MQLRALGSMIAIPAIMVFMVSVTLHLTRVGVGASNAVLVMTSLLSLGLLLAQLTARRRPSRAEVGTDTLHLFLSNGVPNGLMKALAFGPLYALSERFSGGLWPSEWPLLLQVLLAMAAGDLAFYIAHRAAHEHPWLWRWHAVHHSSTTLYALSAARNHPVNSVVSYAAKLFPAVLLGARGETLIVLSIFTSSLGMLQHTDFGLRTGWLGWIFATPEVHHLHHSVDLPEGNSNYGSNLVIWDHLFGTFTPPTRRPRATGITGVSMPGGFWKQLRAPFRWRRLPAA